MIENNLHSNLLSREELAHLSQLKNWELAQIIHHEGWKKEFFDFLPFNNPFIKNEYGVRRFSAKSYEVLCEKVRYRALSTTISNEKKAFMDLYDQLVGFVKANKPLGLGEEDKNFLSQPSMTACYF